MYNKVMNKFESFSSTPQPEQDANLTHDGEPYSDVANAWIDKFLVERAREENIELPDDKNPVTAWEQDRSIPRMFDSFDEIIEDANKSNDKMVRDFADIIDYHKGKIFDDNGEIDNSRNYDAGHLYGECLFYLMHDDELVKKVYAEKCQKDIPTELSMQDLMKKLIAERWQGKKDLFGDSYVSRRTEEEQSELYDLAECSGVISSNANVSKLYDYMNSLMHIMHTGCPEVREEGVEFRDNLLECVFGSEFIENLRGEVYFTGYKGLTGKSSVDETVKAAIEGYLDPIKDDLVLRIEPTWVNSHLYNGLDYDYSIPEDIKVDILATCKESRDMAMQILKSKYDEIEKITKTLGK